MSEATEVSVHLLDAAIAYVRAGFTKAEVKQVDVYGGEFSAQEVPATSYACPAILITVLGWTPGGSRRLDGIGARTHRLAAFVVTKHAERAKRMREAMSLAERLSIRLRAWNPDSTGLPVLVAPLEEDARCENLYGRAIDKAGQALWMVDWEQVGKPNPAAPVLPDLVAVEIESSSTDQVNTSTSNPAPITVTHEITLRDE